MASPFILASVPVGVLNQGPPYWKRNVATERVEGPARVTQQLGDGVGMGTSSPTAPFLRHLFIYTLLHSREDFRQSLSHKV